MAKRGLFQPAKSKRLARQISIKSPNAFRLSIRQVSRGGLKPNEKKALTLAQNRAKAQLNRKNLSPKERKQFRQISKIKIPESSNTLEELKRRNQRLKNQAEARKEMLALQRERKQLMKENKRLVRQEKYGEVIDTGKFVGKAAGKFGQRFGKGFLSFAQQVAENQRRQNRVSRRRTGGVSMAKKKNKKKKKK